MIKFEVTRDPRLLQSYYALREQSFREELNIPNFDGSEEESDRQGHILIARQGNECLGGVRISQRLSAKEHLDELDLPQETCCIWERFTLAPTVRRMDVGRDLIAALVETSHVLGYHHAMVLSSLRCARLYRLVHHAIGHTFEIHRTVPECAQGAFAGLEHYLSISHLSKAEAPALTLVA